VLHKSVTKGIRLSLKLAKPKPKKKKRHLHVVRDDEVEKKESKPYSLIKLIEDVHAEERMIKTGFFRPSMLFGCDRANVFHYQMIKPDPPTYDGRMQRILDNGTAVHTVIQDNYLSNSRKFWFIKEPRVLIKIGDATVKGSCDGVVIRRKTMFKWGIEIKTMANDEFTRLTKPKEEHVFQARIYMELQDLPFITILYWNKDKQLLKEYHVARDRSAWDEITERVDYLFDYVERGELPKYDKAMCNKTFCRNVRHCRKMGAPV
jgi:hypothetical protein